MLPKNRSRMLWILVALTAVYAVVNVLIFYITNSYGPIWFVTSLLVYAGLAVASVYMAFVDNGADAVPVVQPVAAAEPQWIKPAVRPAATPVVTIKPTLVGRRAPHREVVFASKRSQVVREIGEDPEGAEDLVVVTPAGSTRITDIERAVDDAEPVQDSTDEPNPAAFRAPPFAAKPSPPDVASVSAASNGSGARKETEKEAPSA